MILAGPFPSLLELLFPSLCPVCESSVEPGRHLCDECGSGLPQTGLGNWRASLTSGDALDGVWSAFWFSELLQIAIHALKYGKRRGVARDLASLAASVGQAEGLPEAYDMLMPVPLHRTKLRERGFNQAQLLADALGAAWSLPVDGKALRRTRWTLSQTGFTAGERIDNVKGSFSVKQSRTGGNILLIDDVVTTGATASECARILKGAGYARVGVFSIATPLTVS